MQTHGDKLAYALKTRDRKSKLAKVPKGSNSNNSNNNNNSKGDRKHAISVRAGVMKGEGNGNGN